MVAIQLHMPTIIDPRPICPTCKQHVDLLGQVYPIRPFAICRACMGRLDVSMDAFVVDGEGEITMSESSEKRIHFILMSDMLKRLSSGCVLTAEDAGHEYRLPCTGRSDCRKCRAETLYSMGIRSAGQRIRADRVHGMPVQRAFPLCDRCGRAHSQTYAHNGLSSAHCQRCEDELAVEAIWRSRAIFGDADTESIMDRLWKVKQNVFERGVLPDYWYVLMMREEQNNA